MGKLSTLTNQVVTHTQTIRNNLQWYMTFRVSNGVRLERNLPKLGEAYKRDRSNKQAYDALIAERNAYLRELGERKKVIAELNITTTKLQKALDSLVAAMGAYQPSKAHKNGTSRTAAEIKDREMKLKYASGVLHKADAILSNIYSANID